MNKNLEIELRGPLKPKDTKTILALRNNSSKIIRNKQIVVFIKDLPLDFRIKYNRFSSFIEFIKKDKLNNLYSTHNEISFKVQIKDLKKFINILSCFGVHKGFYSPSERIDLLSPNIIWSIKKGSVIGDYWEAEATTKLFSKLKDKKEVLKFLLEYANNLGLSIWSEKEFKIHKNHCWQKVNAQPLSLLWKKYIN